MALQQVSNSCKTFGQDDNALLLIDEVGSRELPRASKTELARQLMEDLATRLDAR